MTTNSRNIRIVDAKNAIIQIHDEARAGNLALLIGAGISIGAPSNLPSGNQIRDNLIKFITKNKRLRAYRLKLFRLAAYKKIIPELIFQSIYEAIEDKIFSIYDILESKSFNSSHEHVAQFCLDTNSTIYTTNFDLLIEEASKYKVTVEHLHGSFLDKSQMIIRLFQIGKGISKKKIEDFKNTNNNKVLLVMGYSGRDKDIVLLLSSTKFKKILWLVRDINSDVRSSVERVKNNEIELFEGDVNELFLAKVNPPTKKYLADKIYKTETPTLTFFESLRCVLSIYFVLGRFNDIKELCEEILEDQSIILSNTERSWCYQMLSDSLIAIGVDLGRAVDCLNLSISLATDYFDLATGYLALSHADLETNPPKNNNALIKLNESLSIVSRITYSSLRFIEKDRLLMLLGKIYNNFGIAYDGLQDFKKAIFYYKKSLTYKRRSGNIVAVASTQANICLAYLSLGNPRFRYWKRLAEEAYLQYGSFRRLAYLMRELGLRSNSTTTKLKYLNKALSIYEDNVPDVITHIRYTKDCIEQLRNSNSN